MSDVRVLVVEAKYTTHESDGNDGMHFRLPVKVVLASDHLAAIAERDKTIAELMYYQRKMRGQLTSVEMTNSAHEKSIATLRREAEALRTQRAKARELYWKALKIVDRYSRESQPNAEHKTVEECMDMYDAELGGQTHEG